MFSCRRGCGKIQLELMALGMLSRATLAKLGRPCSVTLYCQCYHAKGQREHAKWWGQCGVSMWYPTEEHGRPAAEKPCATLRFLNCVFVSRDSWRVLTREFILQWPGLVVLLSLIWPKHTNRWPQGAVCYAHLQGAAYMMVKERGDNVH